MFQDINVVKSAPFALLTKYQKKKKSLYPPKVFKIALIWQITRNSPTIFRFKQREMETSNFTANCAKFTQFANDNSERREIRVIIAKFSQSLLLKHTSTSYSKYRKNSPNSPTLGASHAKLTKFALILINLLFFFLDSRKTGSSTLLARITRISQP